MLDTAAEERDTNGLIRCVAYYGLTALIVILGGVLGVAHLKPNGPKGHLYQYHDDVFANWDGQWYKDIASRGYWYNPERQSSVAFLPAYPLLGAALGRLTGLAPEYGLLAASNLCLVLTFVLLSRYCVLRYGRDEKYLGDYVVLSLALVPTGFFFRMAYSESLFLLEVVLFLYALQRGWPVAVTAVVVGLATATRPVGMALIPPLALYVWDNSPGVGRFVRRLAWSLPVACWGFAAFTAFLYWKFGEPWALTKTRVYWNRRTAATFGQKLMALETFDLVRNLFDPTSKGYWRVWEPEGPAVFSLNFSDPIYFLLTAACVLVGVLKRWLSRYEVTLALFLLLIPYVAAGYETYFRGLGRYAAVTVPAYLVLGKLLGRAPAPLAAALLAVSGSMLGFYAAMFTSYHDYS